MSDNPSTGGARRVGILYEHPDWFRPLFAELDRRGIEWEALDGRRLNLDPAEPVGDFDLVFNRMSPSAFQRGAAAAVFATAEYLRGWESRGVRVVNGSAAWSTELSKIRQLQLISELGLRYPEARFVQPDGIRDAAEEIGYPLVVKPNVGGSGAGVVRFDAPDELEAALEAGSIDLGPTGVGLVQRYIQPTEGRIQRVEVLDGEVLYGIRVYAPEGEFNLCPADACQTADGAELVRGACALDAADNGMKVEAFEVTPEIAREVVAITRAAGIDVGGVEFTFDPVTGERLYYDVNALSNFVADGPVVVGFDPFERLVDWLEVALSAGTRADAPPEPAASRPAAATAGSGALPTPVVREVGA
jgi:glutathione synthase/RimK-type ligase-like ATP-grasp enzyme